MPKQPDELRHTRSVPQYCYQRVAIRFPEEDVDVCVPHDLNPSDPESVEYYVVRLNGPGIIYDDQSPTRIGWKHDCIYLRSSTPDIFANIILILPPEPKPRLLPGPSELWPCCFKSFYFGGSRTNPVVTGSGTYEFTILPGQEPV